MHFFVISLYPNFFEPFREKGVIARAFQENVAELTVIDLRDFAIDEQATVDAPPYGGGGGMVIRPEPIVDAYESVLDNISGSQDEVLTLITSPRGKHFDQTKAIEFKENYNNVIIFCGAFKGIDERALDLIDASEISIGDYVLSSGELPAMVIINSITRLLSGVLGDFNSANDDSFYKDKFLLGPPVYTRPSNFKGIKVPDVLLSGNHQKIREWREKKALEKTQQNRPELFKKHQQSK